MEFVNLTPHDVNIVNHDGANLTIPASGKVARVDSTTITIGEINKIPITMTKFGEVTGLPELRDDTNIIVSSLVAQRCTGRPDVFIPNGSVRNAQGQVIGCTSLGKIAEDLDKKQLFKTITTALVYCQYGATEEAEQKLIEALQMF